MDSLEILEETRHVPLIGLSGEIVDIEVRENTWAIIKLHTGGNWFGSFIINFEFDVPDWLVIGNVVEICENGLLLKENKKGTQCQVREKNYLPALRTKPTR